MLILIPVDNSKDEKHSKIVSLLSSPTWALIDFDEGVVKSVKFVDDWHDSGEDWIDFVVLSDKFENYMEFMEMGMMVLVVRDEESIEDIIEAFKFKELDEIGL